MNLYIKLLVEVFDFNSVKKLDKMINTIDTILQYIIQKIDKREKISLDEYCILKKYIGIYKVSESVELLELIEYFTKLLGNKCNLNWIDVSNITDMEYMFQGSKFNGDISLWNVSNVTNMGSMFEISDFNGDISLWDVSNVTNMEDMFMGSEFNGDISLWDVSNVTDMRGMFLGAKFAGDINLWNISNAADISYMFNNCSIKKEYMPKFK